MRDKYKSDHLRKEMTFTNPNIGKRQGYSASESERNVSRYFNDSIFQNRSLLENENNKIIENQGNFLQNKHDGEYASFSIETNPKMCNIRKSNVIKVRTRTSARQLEILEGVCKTTLKPNKEMRIRLARELGMTERQVQIWFQNKRAKTKKLSGRSAYDFNEADIRYSNIYGYNNNFAYENIDPYTNETQSYGYTHPYPEYQPSHCNLEPNEDLRYYSQDPYYNRKLYYSDYYSNEGMSAPNGYYYDYTETNPDNEQNQAYNNDEFQMNPYEDDFTYDKESNNK